MKHFDLPSDARDPHVLHRLETRVLVRDDSGYVYGGSYKWRADNSDADLVLDAVTENIPVVDASGTAGTQPWFFPGRQDCTICHTRASGGVLGLKTKQSHRDHDFAGTTDNQLRAWNHAGYFSPAIVESTLSTLAKLTPITDTTSSVEQRMRSYLDANCSHCHRPAGVHALWDGRIETLLDDAGIVNGFVGDNLGVTDAHVISPQSLAQSIMHKRLSTATELYKMPPIGKNKVDADAVALLEQWIEQVTAPPAKPLPTPWKHVDIGNVAFTGNAAYGGGAFTVQGSGDDIWGGTDGMHFMYQDMIGDGTLIARGLAQANTDGWAKAGVMIRETIAPGSKHAFTAITPGNGAVSQGRDSTGGESFYDGNTNGTLPKWLRIQRKSNVFISSASDDGSTWTEINRHTIVMTAKVKVGIAVTSHNNGALSNAGFDNVFFMPGVPFLIQRDPQSQLVRAGSAASLRVGVFGDTPLMQWRLNKAKVNGAISPTYAIHATTLKQGGSYDVIVGGKLTSKPATLAVVGEAIGNFNVVASGSTTLTVPFIGSGISYAWSKDGEPLGSNSKISGSMTNKLTIKSFTTADEGDYTCIASAFGSSEQLGPYHLHLLKKPTITNAAPDEGIVSGSFTWQLSSDEPATSFGISALPSGLSYDAKTQRIVGTPNVSGAFTIKVTPTNAAGTGTTQSFTLTIRSLPSPIIGTYAGIIDRHPGVNDDLGGSLTM
ncbi:MAG: putative Ig domain-containing protein, partial [Roseimicrobium sp.]